MSYSVATTLVCVRVTGRGQNDAARPINPATAMAATPAASTFHLFLLTGTGAASGGATQAGADGCASMGRTGVGRAAGAATSVCVGMASSAMDSPVVAATDTGIGLAVSGAVA